MRKATTLLLVAAGLHLANPAAAGYLNGLDFAERCFRAGAAVGASVIPGIPSGVGASEYGCVSDRLTRETGVLVSTYDGASASVPVGYNSVGGGSAGWSVARAGVSRIAWGGGEVSPQFYLTNSRSLGPATVCVRITDSAGIELAESCGPLADGLVSVTATLEKDQFYQAAVELTADYMFPLVNKASVTVSLFEDPIPW